MIKVSGSETKWSSLLARTSALILYISIWIFDFGSGKLPGLSRNGPLVWKGFTWSVNWPVNRAWIRQTHEIQRKSENRQFVGHHSFSFLYKVIYACSSPATTKLRIIIDGLDQFITEWHDSWMYGNLPRVSRSRHPLPDPVSTCCLKWANHNRYKFRVSY